MSSLGLPPYPQNSLNLEWGRCTGGQWCQLQALNLLHPVFQNLYGVYVIWHAGNAPRVVYAGKGNIAERLGAHRGSQEILQYAYNGLFVTWSAVLPSLADGVESFLLATLTPLENKQASTAPHVAVNLPW